MSVFRPAARVTSPDGREWEIYAYKITFALSRGRRKRLRRLAAALRAAARALRSDEWTIEAVTQLPRKTVYRWTTVGEHKGQVLAQVEGHLARGDIPQRLRNAVYRGEPRRSAR